MDEMIQQVAMMAEQGGDPVDVLSMLCTVMAIDDGQGGGINESMFASMTERAIQAAATSTTGSSSGNNRGALSGGGPANGDCYTLVARCIAIYLERQAKVSLTVQISSNMGRQISTLARQIPAAAPTASNSSSNAGSLLRYNQCSPNDFIEDMLRILALHHVYRTQFTKAGVDMPNDSTLVAQTLEWIPHAQRRVLPGLVSFCCNRIVSNGLRGERIGERPVETYLRMLQAELETDDMFRAEELLRVATCFMVRTTPGDDKMAASLAQRLFRMLVERVKSHGTTALITLGLRAASAAVFSSGGGVSTLLQAAGPALRDLLHMALAVDGHSGAIVVTAASASSVVASSSPTSAENAAAAAVSPPASPTSPSAGRSKVRLALPSLFAQTNRARVGAANKKDDETVSDTTWALSVISLIVAGGGGAPSTTGPARVEPRLRWMWQAGDTVSDYTPEASHSLTHSFLLKANQATVQTPHGTFKCMFESMGQASNDGQRVRPIGSSMLPEKVDLIDPISGAGARLQQHAAGAAAAAAAAAAASSASSPAPVSQPVLLFLRAVADSHFLHELGKLRSSEYKGVVDATMLRLLEIGVFTHAVSLTLTATESKDGNNNNNNSGSGSSEVNSLHEEVAHVLVELLQNSSMPNQCMTALVSVLKACNATERQRWVTFLGECGFTDVLAALVASASPADGKEDDSSGGGAGGGGDDSSQKSGSKGPAPSRRQRGGQAGGRGGAAAAAAAGRGGGGGFFSEEGEMNSVPIDASIGATLLGMLGDAALARDAEAAKRSIQDVLRLAASKMKQLEEEAEGKGADSAGGGGASASNNSNRTPPQTNRELRALLMEFATKVRSGRSNPRKLVKEIADPRVMPPQALAAFIAPDASLVKTLARVASSSWFGPCGKDSSNGANSNSTTAFGVLAQCGGNIAKITTSAPSRCCPSGHQLLCSNAKTETGCTLCCSGAASPSSISNAATGQQQQRKAGNSKNNNNNSGGITLWGCSSCGVRYCEQCLPSAAPGGYTSFNISLLATMCDIYRLVTAAGNRGGAAPAASSNSSSSSGSQQQQQQHNDDAALIMELSAAYFQQQQRGGNRLCYAFSNSSSGAASTGRGLPIPASTPVLALTGPVASNSTNGKQYKQRVMTSISTKKQELTIASTLFPSLASPAPASATFAPSPNIENHLPSLRYLAQVIPAPLAASFADELSAWLHSCALDVTLGGPAGLNRRIVECLPALRLVLPRAARFDMWRYCAIGARRRALHTAAEREYQPGGDVPLQLSLRKMDDHAFWVEDRKSDVLAAFERRAQDVINAPMHTRMDCFFKSEVGRGEGPTQEVYSELARQATGAGSAPSSTTATSAAASASMEYTSNNSNNNNNNSHNTGFNSGKYKKLWCADGATVGGLVPAPNTGSTMFALGVACGRALIDGFVVHVPLHEICFRVLNNAPALTRPLLELVDPFFLRSVESLATMSESELSSLALEDEETGVPVTKKLAATYIDATLSARYRQIRDSIVAFGVGLQRVVDFSFMRALFDEADLAMVVCGNRGDHSHTPVFTAEELDQCIVPAQGYNQQSPQVLWVKQALLSFTPEEQSDFVEFLTGSRALPCGGLMGLSTAVTIAKKDFDRGDEKIQGTLPSCSTCFLFFKLPPYSTFQTLRERLLFAVTNGRRNFSHS